MAGCKSALQNNSALSTIEAMSDPQSHIHIEVDRSKKIFRLSAPVFSGEETAPKAIAKFFASLPSQSASTLSLTEDNVVLHEELPFCWGPQPTMRQQFYRFLRRAQQCRHHLRCAANHERFGDAQSILDS